ncbi:cyclic dehypoxanthinyl futalosine synthase [Selenomonas sp. TAMA-11512]|uniref:cyclic dehypoxanthinyl futalosine synthase n=1 Tax=Selenomonas sp. TAMA-11512 TaxID=3095337 RepID=UPI003084D9EA|nr:cyclic dehypoxanthinyl futalosine synthase [Selenomonas sp. TAMA-11512]
MQRLTPKEGEALLLAADPIALGRQADAVRRERHGKTATFIIDRNINYTNICQNECKFCAFYKSVGDPDGYLLENELILEKVREAAEAGATQVMIQGGVHPDLGLGYFETMLSSIKRAHPDIVIHSFTATEILFFAQKEGISVEDALKRLQAAGLDSLPGGGAEILVDEIRQRIAPKKIMTDDWLAVMRAAHRIGMESTATMVIGFGETMAHRIEHMERIRRLQDETGGFRAFITWTFQPGYTELGNEGRDKVSSWDYMNTLALSRLYMDNVSHIQGSWVTQGERIGELSLSFGADDLGSIMLEENVVRAAGTQYEMSVAKMVRMIKNAGWQPAQRNTKYEILKRFS